MNNAKIKNHLTLLENSLVLCISWAYENCFSKTWLLLTVLFTTGAAIAQTNLQMLMPTNIINDTDNDSAPVFYANASAPNYSIYGDNFWIQLTNLDLNAGTASFILHNTINTSYEIYMSTNLLSGPWIPLSIIDASGGTLTTSIPITSYWWENNENYLYSPPQEFFWANGANGSVEVDPSQNTIVVHPSSTNDSSQNVTTKLYFGNSMEPFTASFQMMGSAIYGTDFLLPGMSVSNGIANLERV